MDKTILVIGSEGGIGRAIVDKLKEKGICPICIDKKLGIDITSKDDINKLYKTFKRIDGIVMAHGVTRKDWNTTLDINLTSIYTFLKLMHDRMKRYGGSIVNITSLGGHQGFPNNPQYCSSKGGLRSLTKALAVDWGKYNIRVNNVCPGYILTNMTRGSYLNSRLKKERDKRMVLGRWGKPIDIANAVYFLLSEESDYITGIDLIVDGGWLAKGL